MSFLKSASAKVSKKFVSCARPADIPRQDPGIQPAGAEHLDDAKNPGTNETACDEKSASTDTCSNPEGDLYIEHDITVLDWAHSLLPSKKGTIRYLTSLFPCIDWIPRYNLRWMLGDAIAGLTVGLVVVPQAMAYALLADLTPEFGLYTSFTGAAIYWLFGTSKDIVIGVGVQFFPFSRDLPSLEN